MPAATIFSDFRFVDFLVAVDDDFAGLGVDHVAGRQPADDTLRQRRQQPFSFGSVIQMPSVVPQSSSKVMTSWATSIRRRVR